MNLMQSRAPWYARLVGWILVAFGTLNLAGFVVSMADSLDVTGAEAALYGALTVLPLAGGVGMIRSQSWGWIVAVLGIAAWITFGLTDYTRKPPSFPGVQAVEPDPTTVVLVVLPALAMLGALLAPATIRWLRAPDSN
jgi:hypothetical protein